MMESSAFIKSCIKFIRRKIDFNEEFLLIKLLNLYSTNVFTDSTYRKYFFQIQTYLKIIASLSKHLRLSIRNILNLLVER